MTLALFFGPGKSAKKPLRRLRASVGEREAVDDDDAVEHCPGREP